MIISLDWLSDFVDLSGLESDVIAEKLTVHTAEVEGCEELRRSMDGVVVGRIVSVEPIGSQPGLVVAEIDVGARTLRTVCGAPNAAPQATVAVAMPGAVLASGEIVAASTVHGHASEAVLCSPAELGWSTSHEGLLILPDDLQLGDRLGLHVPPNDTLIEIDNKSLTHRPDLWGHYGIARELAAVFGRPLHEYDIVDLARFAKLPAVDIKIDAGADCPYYAALRIEAGSNRPAPPRMQARLHAIGSRSRNLLVDVTNYVQFELGQPTHAFDGDKVRSIRVEAGGCEQEFATLDGKRWRILPEDLLIHEGKRPIALAGIMGGLDSEVGPGTRTLLLESANFRAARIRQTSTRLGLRTDASLRFEKKLPPAYARTAIGRIVQLFADAGYEHRVVSCLSSAGDVRDQPRRITLATGYVARRAGADISDEESARRLRSIGFGCTQAPGGGLVVDVPAFRGESDISIPEDLSEEVMRLYGYQRIVPALPAAAARATPPHGPTLNHHRVRRILSEGRRFVEVQSYCWYDDAWLREIGYIPPRATLNIRNPLAVDRGRLREALLPNLLAFVLQNRRHADQFQLFELGRLFWIDSAGEKQESNELAGLSVDQGANSPAVEFRAVRSALDDLATAAGIGPLDYQPATASGPPWAATQATLNILREGEVIGSMGVLPSLLRRKLLDSGSAAWFSVDVDRLSGPLHPAVRYKPAPAFPLSWQDFTFVWETSSGYRELRGVLDRFRHPTVRELEFVTQFQPKGENSARYTFRYRLGWSDRTIAPEEIQSFRESFLEFAGKNSLQIA